MKHLTDFAEADFTSFLRLISSIKTINLFFTHKIVLFFLILLHVILSLLLYALVTVHDKNSQLFT